AQHHDLIVSQQAEYEPAWLRLQDIYSRSAVDVHIPGAGNGSGSVSTSPFRAALPPIKQTRALEDQARATLTKAMENLVVAQQSLVMEADRVVAVRLP
ncbi:MAG: hypothetical protein H0W86_13210, partial [Armatimonadetes bacterium]|nr:hypothetical protein [Armatimonadota bacterium]